MSRDDFSAMLLSWEFSPVVVIGLIIAAAIYSRGWFLLRLRGATHFTRWHLISFSLGLATIAIALQSPLDTFGSFSLQVHMVQHLLLILVVPPLILLAAPQLPLLAGSPGWFHEWMGPFARWKELRSFGRWLLHPVTSWALFVMVLWLWHSPALYELALTNPWWHEAEHASFLMSATLFWWPIIRPYPSHSTFSRWLLVPYLFLAGVQGTALAGIITFSNRVLYSHYELAPNLWGISPLTDQSLAGAIMWVPMSIAFLAPLLWILAHQMSGFTSHSRLRKVAAPTTAYSKSFASSTVSRSGSAEGFHLPILSLPHESPLARPIHATSTSNSRIASRESFLGILVRKRWVRQSLKFVLLVLALVVILDGFTGPQVSMVNLAGVAPWIHWRGILVLALLAGGNFFCMACPFTAFRLLTRRWFSPVRNWPRRWQNKWLAVGLLVLFFWAYESYSLWDRPWWTAAMIVGFFVAAITFDALFVDVPFCKFICPIGQFNFVHSLVSPAEVAVTSPNLCASCQTKDCIAGNDRVSGCQLSLYLPKKAGNMDCTFCLDCADACPHNNVALLSVRSGLELASNSLRSGVGRYSERPDLAALMVVLLFAALVNAAWMTAPVIAIEEQVTDTLGVNRIEVVTAGMLFGLCVVPLAMMSFIAKTSDVAGQRHTGWAANLRRFAPALVPLGLGMWLAHYSFHLFTSGDTLTLAATRWTHDWLGGEYSVVATACSCCEASVISWLLPLELLLLDFGLCLSLYVGYRIALAEFSGKSLAMRAVAPWCLFLFLFYASCVWVLLQPMQMRGAVAAGM